MVSSITQVFVLSKATNYRARSDLLNQTLNADNRSNVRDKDLQPHVSQTAGLCRVPKR
jgi:hypothetical protein